MSCSTPRSLLTSVCTKNALPAEFVVSSAHSSPPDVSQSAIATLAPSLVNSNVIARPIPFAPPVTTATLPDSRMAVGPFQARRQGLARQHMPGSLPPRYLTGTLVDHSNIAPASDTTILPVIADAASLTK